MAELLEGRTPGGLLSTWLRMVADVAEDVTSVSDLIAARIKEVRKGKGLNVPRLAKLCSDVGASNLTESVLMNIESGRRDSDGRRRRDVTADELFGVARAMQVSPLVLLLPAEDTEYPIAPGQTATARHVYEWLIGARQAAVGGDDEPSAEERAMAWSQLKLLVSYARFQAGMGETQARVDSITGIVSGIPAIAERLTEFRAEMAELQAKVLELQGGEDGESKDQTS